MRAPERIASGHAGRPVDLEALKQLSWYPKAFGPGDLVGEGAKKLLGTPNIPMVSVLVRETAQNSWDARTAGSGVRFAINLRKLTESQRQVLAERVLTGEVNGLDLPASLERDPLWVLEIADRGTKGLGGSVRYDLEVSADQVSDFVDLIFKIGAPRDVELGGGTYGFGKTVAYQASRCGTVVFWSRARSSLGIEDRLIASAFGDSFAANGKSFTGRHWWGAVVDDGHRVEPLLGNEAADLGRALFSEGFGPDQCGTSLLIVDPTIADDGPAAAASDLANAVLWHLWPKLIPEPGRTPMEIEVLLDDVPIDIPDPREHPVLAGFADCLSLVRAVQQGASYTPRFNTEIFEIRSFKPDKLLGHLALSRYPTGDRVGSSEVDAFEGPAAHVGWMRHDAELVVKYDRRQSIDAQDLQWAGVFKPVRAVDNAFASSEPPAHDDWVPQFIQDKQVKRDVNVALKRIREQVSAFLSPIEGSGTAAKSGRSVAELADRLSALIGALPGSAPRRRSSSPSGIKGAKRPSVQLVESIHGPTIDGRRSLAVKAVLTTPAGVRARLLSDVGVGVEGAVERDDELIDVRGWIPGNCSDPLGGSIEPVTGELELSDGDEAWLVLNADAGIAVDVAVSAEALLNE